MSGKAGASGFTALMDVQQAGWTASSWANALSRSNVPAGVSPRTNLGGRDARHPWVGRGEAATLFGPCPPEAPGGALEEQGPPA